MARPVFGAATRSTSNATTLTATLPTHSEGDLLVVVAHATRRDVTVAINEGYTALFAAVRNSQPRPLSFRAFAKIAGASETDPVVTFGGSGQNCGDAIAYSGTTTTIGDIVSTTSIINGAAQTDAIWPSASVSDTDSIAIRYTGASDDNQVATPPALPAGHTIIIEGEGGGGTWYVATVRVDADPATLAAGTWANIWDSFGTNETEGECTIVIPPPPPPAGVDLPILLMAPIAPAERRL